VKKSAHRCLIGSFLGYLPLTHMTGKKKDMTMEAERYDEESIPWAQDGQAFIGQYSDDPLLLYVEDYLTILSIGISSHHEIDIVILFSFTTHFPRAHTNLTLLHPSHQ
jgi:hypothetical protein